MGSENSKRVNIVSEGRGKGSRILALAILVTLLATTLSVSFTAIAEPEEKIDIEALRAEHKTYYTPTESIADIASALKAGERPGRDGLPMTMIPIEGLEDLLQPDWYKGPTEPRTTNPTPTAEPDPTPTDAPFLANDVLVYSDADSQRNVSMAHFDNGDLLVAYDHFDAVDGNRDVYASMSTDGGGTWNDYPIAADAGEDEACGSIAGDYSPGFGTEMFYSFYNNPTLEFSYSTDGMLWTPVDYGATFWTTVSCPYVVVDGDFVFLAAQKYDDVQLFQDTWYILYSLDAFQTTLAGYFWLMWDDGLSYRPRATSLGQGLIMAAVDIYDQTDPNPANWWHDTLMAYGELQGDVALDDWAYWVWGSGFSNQVYSDPTIASDGAGAVSFTQTVLDPLGPWPFTTSQLFCAWTDSVTASGATWTGCNDNMWILAFDPADTKDQKYPHFHREGSTVHAVWVNGTDINYKYSPDGGSDWIGDPATDDPYKVNEAGVGTHLDEWHSPDVDFAGGKPVVAWHDDRGGDDIYFQTFGNVVIYTIDTQPRLWDLWVREATTPDAWHPPPFGYLWGVGTQWDVETIGNYEIPNDTRYTFNTWDDGSGLNPHLITVDGVDNDIVAIYDVEYWLEMINPGGTTTPVSGYQPAGSMVTIEAFPPAAPPGGQYVWIGWTGIGPGCYTGPLNPCTNCVTMNATATQIANWQLQWDVAFDTVPSGLVVEINGQAYVTPHNHWFNDSEMYSINAPSPQMGGPGLQYVFSSWNDGGPQSHNVFVTAAAVSFIASFTPEYWMTVDTNVAGLQVRVNGMDYAAPYTFWCPDGSNPWLEAVSPQYLGVLGERYIWSDWSNGGSQTHQHTCLMSETVTANYVMQRAVNITTNPSGFNVIVDGMTYATPAMFWWNDSSIHTIEALDTIPVGANNQYQFVDWSDFGLRVHDVTADTSNALLVANYVFQHKITFQANEPGLSIELDSVPTALPYVYWCDDGSTHIINAPSPQTFGDTRYLWASWSDSGLQMHNIVCTAPQIIQVNYDKEYRVYVNTTLDSAASTLDILAGGMPYPTPAEVWWPADTMMSLDTTEFQPGQDPVSGIRFRYVDWDDSAIKDRTVNVNMPGLAYVGNFKTQYRLTFVDPQGTPTTTPSGEVVTGGIYFDAGITVDIQTDDTVPDTADHRYRFDGWSSGDPGGYTGTNNPAQITMNGPITQTAAWMDQYLFTVVSPYGTPTVTGYEEQQSATEYWFDAGDAATFSVEAEVFTTVENDAKAVFDQWVGGTSPATMNAPLEVTAQWHMEYLVTVISAHGTEPAPQWIVEGGAYSLTMEDMETDVLGTTRWQFDSWSGDHVGTARQVQLTVTGPMTVTAEWTTEYLVSIISVYGDDPEPLGTPTGAGWYPESIIPVVVSVEESEERGDYIYHFDGWVGPVVESSLATTAVMMDGPKSLSVEWTREAKFSIMDLWWLFVIIIIIIVVLVAVLLMRKKKPAEEELPPPEEEPYPEEPPAE